MMIRETLVLTFGLTEKYIVLTFSFILGLIMMVGCSDNCLGRGYDGEGGRRPPHPQRQSLPSITT